jgi:hypothetical protein
MVGFFYVKGLVVRQACPEFIEVARHERFKAYHKGALPVQPELVEGPGIGYLISY